MLCVRVCYKERDLETERWRDREIERQSSVSLSRCLSVSRAVSLSLCRSVSLSHTQLPQGYMTAVLPGQEESFDKTGGYKTVHQ